MTSASGMTSAAVTTHLPTIPPPVLSGNGGLTGWSVLEAGSGVSRPYLVWVRDLMSGNSEEAARLTGKSAATLSAKYEPHTKKPDAIRHT